MTPPETTTIPGTMTGAARAAKEHAGPPAPGWLRAVLHVAGAGLLIATGAGRARHPRPAHYPSASVALASLGGYLLPVWIGLLGLTEVRATAGLAAGLVGRPCSCY